MRPPHVAYQGAAGAFSEETARYFAGPDAALLPCERLETVFELAADGRIRWGVVPIENSLAGPVTECVALMQSYPVAIAAETRMRISHALIAPRPVPITAITRVHSHPMALRQCRDFFRAHPHLAAVAAFDTAGAVRDILARGDPTMAAIAGARCARIYGGVVLRVDLETHRDNFTRFLLIGAADKVRHCAVRRRWPASP